MRTERRSLLVTAAVLLAAGVVARPAFAQAREPVTVWRIVLPPFLSPATLMKAFEPLRLHLVERLGQPVQFYTTRDFATLGQAVREGRYDAFLLPAHLAALAIEDWGAVPLSATLSSTEVQLLVRADAPWREPGDLAGQRVAMLDTLSLVATVAKQWLTEQGLREPGRAVTIVEQPSVNTALLALDRGDVAGVFLAASQLRGQLAELPGQRRVMVTLNDIPGPVFVGRADLPDEPAGRLRLALLGFEPSADLGRTAANTRHVPVDDALLQRLRRVVQTAREQLAPPR